MCSFSMCVTPCVRLHMLSYFSFAFVGKINTVRVEILYIDCTFQSALPLRSPLFITIELKGK